MQYTQRIQKVINKSTKDNSGYLEIILTFLTVGFFAWFAIRPTLSTITELIKEIEIKEEILAKLDDKIDALVAADTTNKAVQSRLYLLEQSLPSDHQISQYTAKIEITSQLAGVNLVDLNFSPFPVVNQAETSKENADQTDNDSKNSLSMQTIDFNISANGTYIDLKNFVNQLHQLRRITLIESVEFRPIRQSGRTSSGLLNLDIKGQVLYL